MEILYSADLFLLQFSIDNVPFSPNLVGNASSYSVTQCALAP